MRRPGMRDGGSPPVMARMMSRDAITIGWEVYDFSLGWYRSPGAGTIVPYSPSGSHFPGCSPS